MFWDNDNGGFFGNLFDIDNDGKLDDTEQLIDFLALGAVIEEIENEEN